MPNTIEQTSSEDREQSPKGKTSTQKALAQAAFFDLEISATNFYGGKRSWKKIDMGKHSLVVDNNTVGTGENYESAMTDALKNMETQEALALTIDGFKTTTVWMADGSKVFFTPTEEYDPKVAPSRQSYEPSSRVAKEIIENSCEARTYKNTVETEGWQDSTFGILNDYLTTDPEGRRIVDGLGIRSIRHLTPRQAMQLSLTFVQNLSKYEKDDQGKPAGGRADTMTTQDILLEGVSRKDDPTWKGNGVCRNIAANVKVVFEAIKHNQSEFSMLNSTYCLFDRGSQEDFELTRQEQRSNVGHAWNIFATLDANGSRIETMADVTWALGEQFDPTLEHFDRTRERASSRILETIQKSGKSRSYIAHDLTEFTNRQLQYRLYGARSHKEYQRDRPKQKKEGEIELYDPYAWLVPARQSMVTKYLDKIKGYLDVAEDLAAVDIVQTALTMKDKLRRQELETVLVLSNNVWSDISQEEIKRRFIAGYANQEDDDNKSGEQRNGQGRGDYSFWHSRYVFKDTTLQKAIFDSMNEDLLNRRAKTSEHFRARLRELSPDKLPAFDPRAREEDLREAKLLAATGFGFQWNDDMSYDDAIRVNRSRLFVELGPDKYRRFVAGVPDYELIKTYQSLLDRAK